MEGIVDSLVNSTVGAWVTTLAGFLILCALYFRESIVAVVRKTTTTKDDWVLEKIYTYLDSHPEKVEKILNKCKKKAKKK